jgi:acetoacetyl-CoA synthetase
MSEAEDAGGRGELLWEPSPERRAASRMAHFMRWLERDGGRQFDSYTDLWRWSVEHVGPFWQAIARYFEVSWGGNIEPALVGKLPEAHWFPNATLNYAEQLLRRRDDHVAIVARREDGLRCTLTYAELAEQVARARVGLLRAGVKPGDRVAAFLPNGVEAVVGVLAAASLGAVWSSAAPEFGVKSVLDRFRQIEPTVLLACDGYLYYLRCAACSCWATPGPWGRPARLRPSRGASWSPSFSRCSFWPCRSSTRCGSCIRPEPRGYPSPSCKVMAASCLSI